MQHAALHKNTEGGIIGQRVCASKSCVSANFLRSLSVCTLKTQLTGPLDASLLSEVTVARQSSSGPCNWASLEEFRTVNHHGLAAQKHKFDLSFSFQSAIYARV
jgi:hypothetical protein